MVNKFTDADEIAKFSSLYEDWWKNDGAFGMLHKLTPVRMLFIRQALSDFLERDTELSKTFAGLASDLVPAHLGVTSSSV